jgi:hypothetical protein
MCLSLVLGEPPAFPLRGFGGRRAVRSSPSHMRRTAVRLYVLRRVRCHRSRDSIGFWGFIFVFLVLGWYNKMNINVLYSSCVPSAGEARAG